MSDKRFDTESMMRAVSIEKLIEDHGVTLEKHGDEYKALCPFHKEETPSFTVTPDKGRYYCFGCEANGDHIAFLQAWHGEDFVAAAKRLQSIAGGDYTMGNDAPAEQREAKQKAAPKTPQWVKTAAPHGMVAPDTLRVKRQNEWVNMPVVMAWPYYNRDAELIGYTCRVEPEPGKKDIIPVTWQTNTKTGDSRWKQGAFESPRPLYGAEMLAQNPGAGVILVEGEKAADAARRLIAGMAPSVVVTWPGGSKAINKADWAMLEGRKVIAWPDCDNQADRRTELTLPYVEQPGMKAMLKIAEEHAPLNSFTMRIVEIPQPGTVDNGWDLHDAEAQGWGGKKVLEYIKTHLKSCNDIRSDYPKNPPPERDGPDYDQPMPPDIDPGFSEPEREPFRILGWDRGAGYYLPIDSRQVVSLPASAHTKLNLLQLAPMHYWSNAFSDLTSTKPKIDWDMAADSLIKRAKAAGIFDRDMVRGRGAWWDDGKVAVHLGDRVIMDGTEYNLMEAPTDYVYEAGRTVRIAGGDMLHASEASKLTRICESLRWEKQISGTLLSGFVFLAPVCGALLWRPHIWITGGKGSGKSTVMKDVVGRCLKRNMLFVQGDTSEAGVRQELGQDAIPVLFDEFESERRKAAERTEDVLSLVTAASSETGAVIAKGGQGGKSQRYVIRSMFAFSSISVSIKQGAAMSRISVLSLKTADEETQEGLQQYQELMETIRTTLTTEFIDRLQARAVAMIPVIRHNAEIFAEAAAIVLGTRRQGDQIGTLLAGAYALHSNKEVTPEFAREWLEKRDWSEEREESENSDEMMCLQHIMTHSLVVKAGERASPHSRNVGELIAKLAGKGADADISMVEARDALERIGIRLDDRGSMSYIVIANRHQALDKILDGKPWAPPAHARVLLRLKGARKTDNVAYFKGLRSRGVEIPITHIL